MQPIDSYSNMKIFARPVGMVANFHYVIQINILHVASALNPRLQITGNTGIGAHSGESFVSFFYSRIELDNLGLWGVVADRE
jgi:hypothetical protein